MVESQALRPLTGSLQEAEFSSDDEEEEIDEVRNQHDQNRIQLDAALVATFFPQALFQLE